MFPPLPLEPAKTHALALMQKLDENPLFQESSSGLMLGILVCHNPKTEQEVVLKAFSGQFFG